MSWTRDGAAGSATHTGKRGKARAKARGAARPDSKYQPAQAPLLAHGSLRAMRQPHWDTDPTQEGTKPGTSHNTSHTPTAAPVSASASGTGCQAWGSEEGQEWSQWEAGHCGGFLSRHRFVIKQSGLHIENQRVLYFG